MHTLFIALHAGAGLLALATGSVAAYRGRFFTVYFWSLVGTIACLAAAIAVDWPRLDTASRALFTAFVGLGCYMIWRAVCASKVTASSARYLDHVGFTVVGLFDAFVVIAVLDLGAPIWAVVGAGVLVAAGGHLALRTLRGRRTPVPAKA